MIVIKLKGGLGNQMFQYAFAKSLSEKYSVPFYLDHTFLEDKSFKKDFTFRDFELDVFNITNRRAESDQLKYFLKPSQFFPKLLFKLRKKIYGPLYVHEPAYKYNSDLMIVKDRIYFEGYFQSYKYFQQYQEAIRKDFTFQTSLIKEVNPLVEKIKSSVSVSVHFRRGDMANNKVINNVHGICDLEYYEKAIQYIRANVNNPVFYFFSDEPEWIEKNFPLGDLQYHVIKGNSSNKSFLDMYLMSCCDHNVIANSTFSWWAAWLNDNKNKQVVAPKNWLKAVDFDLKDIYPSDWCII
ncbi:MAG: alpha-1,2-fucosyltransferase [Cytophagaceae bacterium]